MPPLFAAAKDETFEGMWSKAVQWEFPNRINRLLNKPDGAS